MNWLQRIFHEPKDPEVDAIRKDLRLEKERHSRELTKINGALTDLAQEYQRAEQERRSDA